MGRSWGFYEADKEPKGVQPHSWALDPEHADSVSCQKGHYRKEYDGLDIMVKVGVSHRIESRGSCGLKS